MKNETKVNSVSFLDYRFVLAVLAILFISVFASGLSLSDSFATDVPTSVNIKPSLTLTIPEDSISLVLDPASNTFASQDVHITVGTNNEKGYKLILSTPDNNTNLVSAVDSSKTIETLPTKTGGYTEAEFAVNKWGYKLNTGNYIPYVPNAIIMENSTKVNNDTTTLTFASKIDYEKPSGTYATTLSFKTIPTVTSYYMQDLSDPTIANIACRTDVPTIVFDNRDEQAYMIQRLDDGRCWMLDNLRLDLTDFNIVNGLSTINTNTDEASLKSLKEGNRSADIRYATAGLTYENWNNVDSYTEPMVNKNGSCSSTTYPCHIPYQNASYTLNTVIDKYAPDSGTSSTATTIYNIGSGSYKIGIYYNYCAASAGNYCYDASGPDIPPSDSKADYDICPKNWRIPTGDTSGEYKTLSNAIQAKYPTTYHTSTSPYSLQTMLSTPVSGTYDSGSAHGQGAYGRFWSSTYNNNNKMFNLYISGLGANPQHTNYRASGISVRCILK